MKNNIDDYSKLGKLIKKLKEDEILLIFVDSKIIKLYIFNKDNLINIDQNGFINCSYKEIINKTETVKQEKKFLNIKEYIRSEFNPNYLRVIKEDCTNILYCNDEMYKNLYKYSVYIGFQYPDSLEILTKFIWKNNKNNGTRYFYITLPYEEIPLYIILNINADKSEQANAINAIKKNINFQINQLERTRDGINKQIKNKNEKKEHLLNELNKLSDEDKLLLELYKNE